MPSPSRSPSVTAPSLGAVSKSVMLAALALSAGLAAASPMYRCELLKSYDGLDTTSDWPAAINNAGEVAGTNMGFLPIKWDKQRVAHLLKKESFVMGTWVEDINKDGILVGAGVVEGPHPEGTTAYKWQPDGTSVRLYKSPGDRTGANGINDLADIVGWVSHDDGPMVAALWTAAGRSTLPSLQPDLNTWAQAINNRGVVIGNGNKLVNGKVVDRATRWRDGQLADLGVLPGMESSYASAINDTGVIVGYSYGPDPSQPVAWTQGQIKALNLGGGQSGSAWSVNRRGEVIGRTDVLGPTYWADVNAEPQAVAALISPNKPCRGPQGQFAQLETVNDINAQGMMPAVASWTEADGADRRASFRLVPIKVD